MRKISLWAVAFLVLLRLTIGWQFFMEGAQKVRSTYLIGPTTTNKPFSSEGYFRNATGPFAALIRGQLDDPNDRIVAFLTVQPMPKNVPTGALNPAERMPPALDTAWDNYLDEFLTHYRLDAKQMEMARAKLQQAKADYVRWLVFDRKDLHGMDPAKQEKLKQEMMKTVTRKAGGSEAELALTMKERLAEFEKALATLRDFDQKRWLLFAEVDRDDAAAARAKVTELRTALVKEVDERSGKMRDLLAGVVRMKIDDALVLPAQPADLTKELPALLELAPRRDGDSLSASIPKALDAKWKAYFDALVDGLKVDSDKQKQLGERLLDRARERTVRWFIDAEVQGPRAAALVGQLAGTEQAFTLATTALAWTNNPPGPPDRITRLTANPPLSEPEREALQARLIADLQAQSKQMKDGLEELLTATQKAVTPPDTPEGQSFIQTLDVVVIGVITLAGALLLVGLFTRFACILAAGFLLLTFLSAPPFPWLPLPPGTEGNPLYVNKNLIEFIALLALAGTASGRWAGLDGILAWLFGKEDPDAVKPSSTENTPEDPNATETASPIKVQVKPNPAR